MSPTRSAPILGSTCRRTPLPRFPPSRDASAETSVPLRWPVHDGLDLGAVLPAASGLTEWLYAVGLREGWCAVTHPSRSVGLALQFDPHLFRTTWLWGVYGGWRGHYVLLTEPSTSPPGGLAHNVADGTAAWLDADSAIETAVTAVVLDEIAETDGAVWPGPATTRTNRSRRR